GVTAAMRPPGNQEGQELLSGQARRSGEGLVFANLVDFDQSYGHRNDPRGFARALESFDQSLGELLGRLRDDEVCMVTADHGNDPTTPSTDHSREYVPLLVAGARVRPGVDLGTRDTFADVGGTVVHGCNVENASLGLSICAERNAVWKAVSSGLRDFVAVAVTAEPNHSGSPCGACRQVLYEFAPDLEVYWRDRRNRILGAKIE